MSECPCLPLVLFFWEAEACLKPINNMIKILGSFGILFFLCSCAATEKILMQDGKKLIEVANKKVLDKLSTY